MKAQKKSESPRQQPEPFTPGITKQMVRDHACVLFDQGLLDHDPLTFEDWVLAERDLAEELQRSLP